MNFTTSNLFERTLSGFIDPQFEIFCCLQSSHNSLCAVSNQISIGACLPKNKSADAAQYV